MKENQQTSSLLNEYIACVTSHPAYTVQDQARCDLFREALVSRLDDVTLLITDEIASKLNKLSKHWLNDVPYGIGEGEEYAAEDDLGSRERIECLEAVADSLNIGIDYDHGQLETIDDRLLRYLPELQAHANRFPEEFAESFRYTKRLEWLDAVLKARRGR